MTFACLLCHHPKSITLSKQAAQCGVSQSPRVYCLRRVKCHIFLQTQRKPPGFLQRETTDSITLSGNCQCGNDRVMAYKPERHFFRILASKLIICHLSPGNTAGLPSQQTRGKRPDELDKQHTCMQSMRGQKCVALFIWSCKKHLTSSKRANSSSPIT